MIPVLPLGKFWVTTPSPALAKSSPRSFPLTPHRHHLRAGPGRSGLPATPPASPSGPPGGITHMSQGLMRTCGVTEGGCFVPWDLGGAEGASTPRTGLVAAQEGVTKATKCISDDNWFPFWSLANSLALFAFQDSLAPCPRSHLGAGTAAGPQGPATCTVSSNKTAASSNVFENDPRSM